MVWRNGKDETVLFDQRMKTLTGTTTLGQNELGSNGNEGVFNVPYSSRSGASPSGVLVS